MQKRHVVPAVSTANTWQHSLETKFTNFQWKKHTVEGCRTPTVYALLPDKKDSIFCRLLSILKFDFLKGVTIDFEVAVRTQ